MKEIAAGGIYSIAPVEGADGWYYGNDFAGGDLYEAGEIFKSGHRLPGSRLVLIRYPGGETVELRAGENRCWGNPVGFGGGIYTLLVDFSAGTIEIGRRTVDMREGETLASLPLESVEDCYNLMLRCAPPVLIRYSRDEMFEILWPDRARFRLGVNEALCARDGDRLYFSAWYEDPDYREELVVRDAATGEVLERRPGAPWLMPDGRLWLIG